MSKTRRVTYRTKCGKVSFLARKGNEIVPITEEPIYGGLVTWYGIGRIMLVVLIAFIVWNLFSFYLQASNSPPSKSDGWVYFSGGGRYVGHESAIGICRHLADCEEIFVGCGAVNCDCHNLTSADIDAFFQKFSCVWISGEGIVCRGA